MQNNRLEKLQEMLDETPQDIFLNYALALEYKGLSQYDNALKQLNTVFLLDENHIPNLYQLGVFWMEKSENEKALLYLEKGLQIAKQKKELKTANEFQALIDEILY